MSDANLPPRFSRAPDGTLRLKLKRGRLTGYGQGADAHFFDPTGRRVDANGEVVRARARANFMTVDWDFPDPPAPWKAEPPRLDAIVHQLSRSDTFARLLDAVQRAGWALESAESGDTPGAHKGPNVIAVDLNASAPFARLVHHVALAHALDGPLAIPDPGDPLFVRENAIAYLRRDGAARLDAAIVRDEILAAGRPDIGGPGLRGDQLLTYHRFKRGLVPRAEAADAIGLSHHSHEASAFHAEHGPRIAQNLARAFGPARAQGDLLGPEVIALVDRARRAPDLPALVGAHPTAKNPYFVTYEGPLDPPLSRIEMRVSTPTRARRVLLRVRPDARLTYAAFAVWYGEGTPLHVDASECPLATVAASPGAGYVTATYAVTTGALASIALDAT
jgi:hypothetical protein